MSSVVNYRFIHANQFEQVLFSGHGIRCLDLKREIYEKKRDEGKINSSLDFELRIADESSNREYEDEEIVPKNASVIVRKLPPRPGQRGLVARFGSYRSNAPPNGDIVINVRAPAPSAIPAPAPASAAATTTAASASASAPPPSAPAATTPSAEEEVDEEAAALEAIGQVTSTSSVTSGARTWVNTEVAGNRGTSSSSSMATGSGGHQTYGAALTCHRCKKPGHVQNNCPLIAEEGGMPYERRERVLTKMYNVAKTNVNNVTNLSEVDTKNKTVMPILVSLNSKHIICVN